MSDNDGLWAYVARQIKKLPNNKYNDLSAKAVRSSPKPKKDSVLQALEELVNNTDKKSLSRRKISATPKVNDPFSHADIDKNTYKKLVKGKIGIEAKLDLHGLSQDQAHDKFCAFITRTHKGGKRCVLVVTGKGRGILKSALYEWALSSAVSHLILKVATAQPKDGGDGAFYIYLKRG